MAEETKLKIIIVGCGLGGLACAISCRHGGLDVLLLEKTAELSEIGAGIQLPPNAARIMSDWNLITKLREAGGMVKGNNLVSRWSDGRTIGTRPGKDWAVAKFGHPWYVMHRADYQRVLADEAHRLGAKFRFGADVIKIDCNKGHATVTLADGESLTADVVVGADGLRGNARTFVLGHVKEPEGSGDLAYRITIPRAKLENDPDPFVQSIVTDSVTAIWWAPNRHVVMYGIRGDQLVNLVLVCPDNLPLEVSRQGGDLDEMHQLFQGWDPRLRVLLGKVDSALKWKIWTMEELDVWVKDNVALLGDACHPSVPYAASGAAMAVEDGAVLGRLLSRFEEHGISKTSIPALLELYQNVRKQRAQTTVRTANGNRTLYHMEDGPEQEERDRLFAQHDWSDESRSFPWVFADLPYLHELFGFDTLKSAEDAFSAWIAPS